MPELIDPNEALQGFCDVSPAIAGMIYGLPWGATKWSKAERDLWFKAFNAVCDFVFPESISDQQSGSRPPLVETEKPAPRRKTTTAVSMTAVRTTEESGDLEAGVFDSRMPYRGSKQAADIVLEIIHSVGQPADVWLNSQGRVKVAGPDYQPAENDLFVGTYGPTTFKSIVATDLKNAGKEIGVPGAINEDDAA